MIHERFMDALALLLALLIYGSMASRSTRRHALRLAVW